MILRDREGNKEVWKYIVGVHAGGGRFTIDEVTKVYCDLTPDGKNCPRIEARASALAAPADEPGTDPTRDMGVDGNPVLEPNPQARAGIPAAALDDAGAALIGGFDDLPLAK
jgi:hypothetical protein